MKEITREEANKILGDSTQRGFHKAVIAFGGKWYDIRGKTDDEIQKFIISLVGKGVWDRGQVSIEIKL